ncbi:hypothetical protein AN644_04290 [Candidatus Epulonipiscium fishelsonii]|nr:hypothetical protein AN644_04290 [Epulopiscium sp. SCG-C06WGA-EpuloA1]
MKLVKKLIAALLAQTMLLAQIPLTTYAETTSTYESSALEFITVDGVKLMDGDEEFRFASINYPQALTDKPWEQKNVIETIQAMGGKVTRTYSIPTANGANSKEAYVVGVDKTDTTGGEYGTVQFNDDVLVQLDQLLAYANEYGVRLIIPLTDHWSWSGGIEGYLKLATGKEYPTAPFDEDTWEFYSNDAAIDYFMQMIDQLMNRTNTITGVKYKDDPAVFCWETGNEFGAYEQDKYDDQIIELNNKIVDRIHENGAKQLILDGRMSMTERSLSAENKADILGAHYYTGNYVEKTEKDSEIANDAGKPFILGEFGGYTSAAPAEEVFKTGYEHGADGVMMWSLRAHKDGWGYYWHDENPGNWAAYHWPGFDAGEYFDEDGTLEVIYKYAQIMDGGTGNEPIPPPSQTEPPVLFDIDTIGDIKWRGVVGGAWYEIERAEGIVSKNDTDADWTKVATEKDNVHDGGRPGSAGFHDVSAIDGKTYTYRLRAANDSGTGLWSNYQTVDSATHFIKDELDLIAVSKEDTNPTEVRNVYSYDHSTSVENANGSIINTTGTIGYITYYEGIPIKNIVVHHDKNTNAQALIYVSKDGINYEEATENTIDGDTLTTDLNEDDKWLYARIVVLSSSQCKINAIDMTYTNSGIDYDAPEELPKDSILLQDDEFKEGYTFKDSTLEFVTTEDYKGLGVSEGSNGGEIIYQTYKDLTSFRIKASTTDSTNIKVSYSENGLNYVTAKPTTQTDGAEGFVDLVFEEIVMPINARYLKIELLGTDTILKHVELASGDKRIPIYEVNPINILENAEVYFGRDENLQGSYITSYEDGNLVLTKNLDNIDISAYDVMNAWISGDSSNNTIFVELEDNAGDTWTVEKILSGEDSFESFNIDKDAIDETNIVKLRIGIKPTNQDNPRGEIYLDQLTFVSSTNLDNFEGYSGSSTILREAYKLNGEGGSMDLHMEDGVISSGEYSLRIDYNYNGKGYAGVTKQLGKLNLKDYDGIKLWYVPDGTGNSITFQIKSAEGKTFETGQNMTASGPTEIYIPFENLKSPSWDEHKGTFDKNSDIIEFSLYSGQNGEVTQGTIYFDEIQGFNFIEDLASATVDITQVSEEITKFPFTFSGSTTYVNYITLDIGGKKFNVPVVDGKWEHTIDMDSKVYNGTAIPVKAEIRTYDDTIISEASTEINLNVEGNVNNETLPPTEEAENLILNGTFESVSEYEGSLYPKEWESSGGLYIDDKNKGTEGADPDYYFTIWSQDPFDAQMNQYITIPKSGRYQLSFDVKAKANLDNAEVKVTENGEELFSKSPLNTEDQWQTQTYEMELTPGRINLAFAASIETYKEDGPNFAVDNIELILLEEIEIVENNLVQNSDFAMRHPVTGEPEQWEIAESGATFAYNQDGYIVWDVAETNASGLDVNMSQDIAINESGYYDFYAQLIIDKIQEGYFSVVKDDEIIEQIEFDENSNINSTKMNAPYFYLEKGSEVTIEFNAKSSDIEAVAGIKDIVLARATSIVENSKFIYRDENDKPKEWELSEAGADFSYSDEGHLLWSGTEGFEVSATQSVTIPTTGMHELSANFKVSDNLTEAYLGMFDKKLNSVRPLIDPTQDEFESRVYLEEGDVDLIFYAKAPTSENGAYAGVTDIDLQIISASSGADVTPPTFNIEEKEIAVIKGFGFELPIVTAVDDKDENVTISPVIIKDSTGKVVNEIVTDTPTTYTATYTATDTAGNIGEVVLTIKIMEFEKSVTKITQIGDSITDGAWWRLMLLEKLHKTGFEDIVFVGNRKDEELKSNWDENNNAYERGKLEILHAAGLDHEGRGGTLVANEAPNIATYLSVTNPDMAMMHYGTNDIWTGTQTPDDIIKSYSVALEGMRSVNPEIALVVAKITPLKGHEAIVEELNSKILGWASYNSTVNSPIIVVDQYTGFNTSRDLVDDAHPDYSGEVKMTNVWFEALSQILKTDQVLTDVIAPFIQYEGETNIDLDVQKGEIYTLDVLTAIDTPRDLQVAPVIVNSKGETISGNTIDLSFPETYVVTYAIFDDAGNEAAPIDINISVNAPNILLNGDLSDKETSQDGLGNSREQPEHWNIENYYGAKYEGPYYMIWAEWKDSLKATQEVAIDAKGTYRLSADMWVNGGLEFASMKIIQDGSTKGEIDLRSLGFTKDIEQVIEGIELEVGTATVEFFGSLQGEVPAGGWTFGFKDVRLSLEEAYVLPDIPVLSAGGKTTFNATQGFAFEMPKVTATDKQDGELEVSSIITNSAGQTVDEISTAQTKHIRLHTRQQIVKKILVNLF